MPILKIFYRGYQLTARDQPGGGYQVEIGPVGSDRTVFTQKFAKLQDALASARHYVDLRNRTLH